MMRTHGWPCGFGAVGTRYSVRFLVFQHIAVEHPGVFREFLDADGVAWDVVELDGGDKIPSLDGYAALWVMGGPMDVWEEDRYPWLTAEKAAIREAVAERRMPFLGVCLGHQLLAAALGGECAPMVAPEVGMLKVELTAEGRSDPLFAGIPPISTCLQWHSSRVSTPPRGTIELAISPSCGFQAMRVGQAAYGLQFHIEITGETVPEWGRVPAYATALERLMGTGALAQLENDAHGHLAALKDRAKRLYENFMGLVKRRAPVKTEPTACGEAR